MDTPVSARLRIGGRLFDDTQWSVGLTVSTPTGQDPFAQVTVDTEAEIDAWADRVKGLNGGQIVTGGIATLISTRAAIEFIRCSRVNEAGRETYVSLITMGDPVRGTGSAFLPAQTALVASLLTGRPGAANRGRIYWPALSTNLTAAGRIPTTVAQAVSDSTATWVAQVGEALAPGLNQQVTNVPAIRSRSTGKLLRVTGVRVGNRLDSQRRRAEGQQEAYSSSLVAQQ